jgi:hypothetical protein
MSVTTIPTRNMVDTLLYDPCYILPECGRCLVTRSAGHLLRASDNVDVSAHTILGTFDYWYCYCDSWRPTFLMRKSSYEFTSESFPSSSWRKTYLTARSFMANSMTVKERIIVDQAVTTVWGCVCKITRLCFLCNNSCDPLGTCIVFL